MGGVVWVGFVTTSHRTPSGNDGSIDEGMLGPKELGCQEKVEAQLGGSRYLRRLWCDSVLLVVAPFSTRKFQIPNRVPSAAEIGEPHLGILAR